MGRNKGLYDSIANGNPCVKWVIIKIIYGSTMFEKLWEWIMGIIAWIMSKFSRCSAASNESAEAEQQVPTQGGALEDGPSNSASDLADASSE